ncbi:DUF6193 family natural product biosynthesis protein [Kitasatospora sp. NPDC005856]|uniref:DUF6193 family natural product biosynthesis protein n=1 Tax=Kitasatospora sp. NPDC005856 TaxID=3154566 RepID=UPI0033C64F8F
MPEPSPGTAPDDALRAYATLYPDVAQAGSLRSALQAQADRDGHRLTVEPNSSPGWRRVAAQVTAGDRSAHVLMAAHTRSFTVSCWTGEVQMADGSTDDLAEAAGAMDTWQAGARLAELLARRPFLHTWELAEAHERGDAIPVRWRQLREHAASERSLARRHGPELKDLLEAAHAQPRLRALSPGRSVHWLTFSRRAAPPICRDLPRAAPIGDGRYRLRFADGRLQETAGAAAAVTAIVEALPDDALPA